MLVLQFTVACIVARKSPKNWLECLYGFLAAGGVAVFLGICVQTFLPRFSSKLHRRPNNAAYIINFAYSFGSRAQRCLTDHLNHRLSLESPQAQAVPIHVIEVCDSIQPFQLSNISADH